MPLNTFMLSSSSIGLILQFMQLAFTERNKTIENLVTLTCLAQCALTLNYHNLVIIIDLPRTLVWL